MNSFDLLKFRNQLLAESISVEENTINEDLSYLSSWKVLKGPGGYIFQIQGGDRNTIDARVNKSGMATLDGEGDLAVKAIQQIASQFGAKTDVPYGPGTLTTTIAEPDFNTIFPDTISEVKMTNADKVGSDGVAEEDALNEDLETKKYYILDGEGMEPPMGPFNIMQASSKLLKLGDGYTIIDQETKDEIYSDDTLDEGQLGEALQNDDLIYDILTNMDLEQLVSDMLDAAENNPSLTLEDFLNRYSDDEDDEGELDEGQLKEMASFYKVIDNSPEAKAAIAAEKEKYKPGSAFYNTLDSLEKTGEADYKKWKEETGKDMATWNNEKSRNVLEKGELSAFIKAGRPVDPDKEDAAPKDKSPKLKITNPKPKTKSTSTKLADLAPSDIFTGMGPDEEELEMDKQAAKAAKGSKEFSDEIAPDKTEKFNTGLKFVTKYKDDRKLIDAYLKKAKEEYKLSANMIKDLKRAAGRQVEA